MYYYKTLDGQYVQSERMMLADNKPIQSDNPITGESIHYCEQCREDMGNEWILGPVCGRCVRKNHRKVTQRGQGLVEFALILAMVLIVGLVLVFLFAPVFIQLFTGLGSL